MNRPIDQRVAQDRRDATIADLCGILEHLTTYAECKLAAFSSGRAYLDLTGLPRLCAEARAILSRVSA